MGNAAPEPDQTSTSAAQNEQPKDDPLAKAISSLKLRGIGPALMGRAHCRYCGASAQAQHLVCCGWLWRRLEDDKRWHNVGSHLRRSALVLHRLRHAGSIKPRSRLGWHRRERQRSPRWLGRWRLPQPQRWAHVGAYGARNVRTHR